MEHIPCSKQVMVTIFLSTCLLFIPLASAREVEAQNGFSYTPGAADGPENWASLNASWTTCGTGQEQSPIDITDDRIETQSELGRLIQSYRSADATILNRGIYIEVEWDDGDAGNIKIDGTQYNVLQLHWHSPSEHTINGRRYDLELHIVHESMDNRMAVVGVLYSVGLPDPFIAQLEPFIRNISNVEGGEQQIGRVNPRGTQGIGTEYYRYMGSLTTPPCTEGVVWTILEKISSVSAAQVNLLKDAVSDEFRDNARPIQSINDRVISLYEPQKIHK